MSSIDIAKTFELSSSERRSSLSLTAGCATAVRTSKDTTCLTIALYHLKFIWLFTRSDIKTIIIPYMVFGLIHAYSSVIFSIPSTAPLSITTWVFHTIPSTVVYLWINLLPFNIDNQRQPDSVAEDAINKPLRTLPSGRMSLESATNIMWNSYIFAFGTRCMVGGWRQCITLMLLGNIYNNRQGAEASPFTRNMINSGGYLCLSSGAMEVALGRSISFST